MAGKNKDASLNKRAFTSGFFFILAQLFARGLTFAVTPVYSRLLTKAQYGIERTYTFLHCHCILLWTVHDI